MKSKGPEAVTALDQFRIQEAAINADVAESEKHYDRIIEEQTKIREGATAARAKAQAVLAGMIEDYERIDAELEGEAAKRMDLAGLTKQSLADGRITPGVFFKQGLTDAEATAKAQAAASEKLAAMREATRAQAVRVMELELAEAEAEYNIAFAMTAPASAFREKLAALLKALEASLASPLGVTGGGTRYAYEAKKAELQIATSGRLRGQGTGWIDYDLAGLKRLRLSPLFPWNCCRTSKRLLLNVKRGGRASGSYWSAASMGNFQSLPCGEDQDHER